MAEDRAEAEKVIKDFPTKDEFEAWLLDIQTTVKAIRIRLPLARNPSDSTTTNCRAAYDLFKTKQLFTLAPDPARGENFHIINIDPISGLPNLISLNLRENDIINIKFLRNLTKLQFLDLAQNKVEIIPRLYNRYTRRGLMDLKTLGLEFQDVQKPLDIAGVSPLTTNLISLRLGRNQVPPDPLRGLPRLLRTNAVNTLLFAPGTPSCDKGDDWDDTLYPDQIEEERLKKC